VKSTREIYLEHFDTLPEVQIAVLAKVSRQRINALERQFRVCTMAPRLHQFHYCKRCGCKFAPSGHRVYCWKCEPKLFSRKVVYISCDSCSESFYRGLSAYRTALRRGSKRFYCCNRCKWDDMKAQEGMSQEGVLLSST